MNKERQLAIDNLLDKIRIEGFDSLSPEEIQLLNKLGGNEGKLDVVEKDTVFQNNDDPKRSYNITFEYEKTLNILGDNVVYPKHTGMLTIKGAKFPNGTTTYYGGFYIKENKIVDDFIDELSEELTIQMDMDENLKRDIVTFLKLTNIELNLQR